MPQRLSAQTLPYRALAAKPRPVQLGCPRSLEPASSTLDYAAGAVPRSAPDSQDQDEIGMGLILLHNFIA